MSYARLTLISTLLIGRIALSQNECGGHWLPGEGTTGTNGPVYALTQWDPDGSGPRSPVLVVGGKFTLADTTRVDNIATCDPETRIWSPLGSGMSGPTYPYVGALTVLPDGRLVASGQFTTSGSTPVRSIAVWNGQSWAPLGQGIGGQVGALHVMGDGNLVAGGLFHTNSGAPGNYIARWTGVQWTPLSSGMNSGVFALASLLNRDLVAGGGFYTAGGAPANSLARWDGAAWSPLGAGVGNIDGSEVRALLVLSNGDLIAAGKFSTSGGAPLPAIAMWDGAAWLPLGNEQHYEVYALAELPNGDVVAGGRYISAAGVLANCIARWDGASWHAIGSGLGGIPPDAPYLPTVLALAVLADGDLVCGGYFDAAGSAPADYIARWDGAQWTGLGSGMGGSTPIPASVFAGVRALSPAPDGGFIAGGWFNSAGGVPATNIARWDGVSWSALGSGMSGAGGQPSMYAGVYAVTTLSNGQVIAGGGFSTAGGAAAARIARWDGMAWSPIGLGIGTGLGNMVFALKELPNGDLVAGGAFGTAGGHPARNVARWDGTSWQSMGSGVGASGNQVRALALLPNGDLVAAGTFTSAGGAPAASIARWNGSAWSALGPGLCCSYVNCLATLPSGDLVAGGRFATPALNIARWDGAAWWPLGSGVSGGENASVLALHVLPNGDLVACGTFEFAGGHPADRIARWDGARWSTLDTGLGGTPPNAFYPPSVLAVTALRSGEIVAGGSFTAAGGQTSAYWARWTETGSPWIARHPAPSTAHCPGQPAAFSVTPASGYGALTLRWQIESPQFPGTWLTLGSDPLPLPCGGSAWATQPASASTTIGVQPCAGMYAYRVRATVANECGSTSSEPAMLSVCYANCDCSSLPPVLSTGDLLCFLNRFASLDPYANCDGSTAPPALNVQDFLCFLNAFSAGCP